MFVVKWIIMAVAVLAASYVIPGIHVRGFFTAIIAALVLGLINVFIRPLLVLLTLPLTLVTLGLFLLVINALLLYLTSAMVTGFVIKSFWSAFFGSIFITIVGSLLGMLVVI